MDCGGRYSLINALPYDRHQTTMAEFRMCEKCKKEYENPLSRRFHSQINCCSNCGPKLFFTRIFKQESFSMYVPDSKIHSFLEGSKEPLSDAIHALKNGEILALKGVGGYTLVCDATNKDSIRRLRLRKNRPTKPFAIMCKDIKMARLFAVLKPKELNLLTSCIAPIVLSKSKNSMLPLEDVAPNLSTLGIILPYAPLHYLLFKSLDFPLIFTSANLSGEPIIKDYYQIHQKLSAVCDAALFYDRDISNPVDDSLVRVISDEIQVLRRARGYLCDIPLECEYRQNAVALGAQQKVTFTFCHKNKVLLSPHLGDLDNLESF